MISIVEENRAALANLCQQHRVQRLELFGSASREAQFGRQPAGRDPLAELDGGLDLGNFGWAKSVDSRQVLDMGAIEAFDPAELAQQLLGERRSILTGDAFLQCPLADAEHNGQKLGRAQVFRAMCK